jgi:hypothetical protein
MWLAAILSPMTEQEPHQDKMQKSISVYATIFVLLVIAFIVWLIV